MADSDSNPSDAPDPRHTESPPVKPVAPVPRINPPNINAGKEKSPAAGPPGFIDFLEWMRSQMASGEAATDQRTPPPKERKKFQRQDAEAKTERPAPPLAAPAEPSATIPPLAAPSEKIAPPASVAPATPAAELPPPGSAPSFVDSSQTRVRRGQQGATKRNFWVGALVQAGVLTLLVLSFLLGRASVSKVAPAPNAAPAAPEITTQDGKTTTDLLSSANAALIDRAMAATQASHFKEAAEALDKVKASGQPVRGLTLQRAMVALFANEGPQAVPLLNEAIAEGVNIGEAYNLRATLNSRRNVFRSTANDYVTASKLDPFDARIFFYWGSALRRSGMSQEAMVHLQQALDRLREPTVEGYYQLALRTTQIEVGQEKQFADELTRQLALPYPNIDWLFTAAALALRDGKYAAAVAYLDRAEQCGDPDGFALRLRDFYFEQFNTRKELARFFAKLAPPKPGRVMAPAPPPEGSPSPAGAAAPLTGLDVPALPPPASPGATVGR